MSEPLIVNKQDLRENIVEWTRSQDNLSSNFMKRFEDKLDAHMQNVEKRMDAFDKRFDNVDDKMNAFTEWKGKTDGKQEGAGKLFAVALTLVVGLIGVIYTIQANRIDKVEAAVVSLQSK